MDSKNGRLSVRLSDNTTPARPDPLSQNHVMLTSSILKPTYIQAYGRRYLDAVNKTILPGLFA